MDNNTENKNINNEDNIGVESVDESGNSYTEDGNAIQSIPGTRNFKPAIGVVVVLIVILLAYFFLWRSIAAKTKNVVADSLSAFEYKSIGVSGFPFSKNVKIKDITFGGNNPFTTQNKISFGEIEISSLIFGESFKVKFKDILITTQDDTKYNLLYNGKPVVNIIFYQDGRLKYFSYKDNGYRVTNADTNETLYTAGESTFSIDTTINNNTIDYAITGLFKDMQNLELINVDKNIDTKNVVPEKFNLNIDISSSITLDSAYNISNYIVKINLFDLLGDAGSGIQITGEIVKDTDDVYSYGNIDIALLNYQDVLKTYKENILSTENSQDIEVLLGDKDIGEFTKMVDNVFNQLSTLISQNTKTTDKKGVISIVKQKNTPDYFINGQSLYGVIQNILLVE